MKLFANDQVTLTADQDQIFIHVHTPGAPFSLIHDICVDNPRIHIEQFVLLKQCLERGTEKPLYIGSLKPLLDISISADHMRATLQVFFSPSTDLTEEEKISAILYALKEKGVVYGTSRIRIEHAILSGVPTVVAEGVVPVDGQDATYTYFSKTEKQAQMTSETNDVYDMKLVDIVQAGEWLGEKKPPTKGTPGRTVMGEVLPARQGREHQLRFDPETVMLDVQEDGTAQLRSKKPGAVVIDNGRISVSNHLVISGDVNYQTGSIHFEGSVTIHGTVNDRFSVTAEGDVEILSEAGIGAVKHIVSKNGSIYVRGGINGKGMARLFAAKDIYARFVNRSTLEAGDLIHIGSYSFDSHLRAAKIQLSSEESQLVGGEAIALHRIESGIIGNHKETRTKVQIKGFNRSEIQATYNAQLALIEDVRHKALFIRDQLEILERNMDTLDQTSQNTYEGLLFRYEQLIDEILVHQRELKRLEDMLLTKGDGELRIAREIHPRCVLELKKQQKLIRWKTNESFYVEGKTIHAVN